MANFQILKHIWNDPSIWQRERWWTVAWLVWGVVCAAGVGFGDQSLPEGIAWLLASTLIAAFGQPIWVLFSMGFGELSPDRLLSGHRSDDGLDMDSDSEPSLYWLEKRQLTILDPNRKCWEVYPLVVLAVAPIHGLWAGSLVGLAEFFFGDWSNSALQGALMGSLGGTAVVMLLYAIVAAVLIAWTHGPKIESLRPIVRQACAVGDNHNHEMLLPGHLLLALIETPIGPVAELLARAEGNIDEARHFILEETDKQMRDFSERNLTDVEIDIEDELLDGSAVLAEAIEEARSLRHCEVGAGHVLLGLPENRAGIHDASVENAGIASRRSPATHPELHVIPLGWLFSGHALVDVAVGLWRLLQIEFRYFHAGERLPGNEAFYLSIEMAIAGQTTLEAV